MVHVDGALAPISARSKSAIERTISTRTGARVERRGNCQEYWIVGRQCLKDLLLCARLPKTQKPPKAKGTISHELSAMLVAASRPTPQDVFLDLFAGSGSFASARLEQPVRKVWYSDLDLEQYRRDLGAQLAAKKRARLLAEDAPTLPSIDDGSIDVIVTDPPWGEHEDLGRPYDEFARATGSSFARVLHPSRGRYVLLVKPAQRRDETDGLAAAGLPPDDEHEVLVNGHPATVLIGERRQGEVVRLRSIFGGCPRSELGVLGAVEEELRRLVDEFGRLRRPTRRRSGTGWHRPPAAGRVDAVHDLLSHGVPATVSTRGSHPTLPASSSGGRAR